MERDINRLRQEFSEGIQNIVDDFSHRLERLNPEYHRRKEREQRMTALTILLGILIGGALLAWRSLSQPTDYDEGR
jgi:hypothetical protein